jgi:hypothetical protein
VENLRNFDELMDSDVVGKGNRGLKAEENVELKHEGFGNKDYWSDSWWNSHGLH